MFNLSSLKGHWPGFVLLGLGLAYTLFWFVMAGRVEGGIERWIERQARHGTEVTYETLKVSGFPFRLQARFEAPQIIALEHDSGFSWTGERLRIVTRVFDINHIIIDLFGNQSLSWIDDPADGSRTPSTVSVDFSGDALRGSLILKSGRIKNIDTDFRKIIADIYTDGTITLVLDGSDHVEIDRLEYHSQLLKGKNKSFSRDVLVRMQGMTRAEKPSPDLDSEIEEILIAFSEEVAGMSALHSGDIGGDLPPQPAQTVKIHDAHILWPPLSARVEGKLSRSKKGKREGDFNGKVKLYLKGHEDLVRQMAEEGDTEPAVAVVAGALFGILEMVTDENEEGELVVPLKVKDGEVFFGFLPLFEVDG